MPQQIEIQIKKSYLAAVVITAGLLAGLLYTVAAGSVPGLHDHDDHAHEHSGATGAVTSEMSLRDRFDVLSQQSSNSCGLQPQHIDDITESDRLQGSCCAAMNFHSYKEQVTGLEQYANYEIIPPDPYNVSVEWAERMVAYNQEMELTDEQQAVYDEATELSHEGGPCCCKCWHWYAYAGLGKKLIIEHDFTAEQIAEVWDLSDACGGDHVHT